MKTSRDISAFLPETLVENDSEDDIVVLVWHQDKEDSLILLGWECVETLQSKVETEQQFSGDSPAKLEHLATRPMNDLQDLGPNTANMNQTPENPYQPGDRVRKRDDEDASTGVVGEVDCSAGQVSVVYEGPRGDEVAPTDLREYCSTEDLSTYEYPYSELELADMRNY